MSTDHVGKSVLPHDQIYSCDKTFSLHLKVFDE